MSADLDLLQEEALIVRKWATEKEDWLENMAVQKRYEGDPASLARRGEEVRVMRRLADRLNNRIAAMQAREMAA